MKELIDFLEKKGFTQEANNLRNGGTSLNLSYKKIGAAWAEDLAEGLKANTSLTQLGLGGNLIGDAEAKDIAEALNINTSLTQLDLYNNLIGDAGAKDIAERLKTNTSLTQLSLSSNLIGAAGAKDIAERLKTNTSLTQLDLSNNKIGVAGAKEIWGYIQRNIKLSKENNQRAETLNTQGNSFCKDGKYDKAIEKYNEAIAISRKPLYFINKTNAEKKYEQQLQKEEDIDQTLTKMNMIVENNTAIIAKNKVIIQNTINEIAIKVKEFTDKTNLEKINEKMKKLVTSNKITRGTLLDLEDEIDEIIEQQTKSDDNIIVNIVKEIVYDKPLLNHPELLGIAMEKFSLKEIGERIDELSPSLINTA